MTRTAVHMMTVAGVIAACGAAHGGVISPGLETLAVSADSISIGFGASVHGSVASRGAAAQIGGRITGDAFVSGDVSTHSHTTVSGRVFSTGGVTIGSHASISGVFATGDVQVGAHSKVLEIQSGSGVRSGSHSKVGSVSEGVVGAGAWSGAGAFLSGLPDPVVTANDVYVSARGSATLAPGSYGVLNLSSHSTLKLGAGRYSFRSVTVGSHADIVLGGEATIDVLGDAHFSSHAGLAAGTPDVVHVIARGDVTVGSHASLVASVASLGEAMTLSSHAKVSGSVYAVGRASIGSHAVVRGEGSFAGLPAPGTAASVIGVLAVGCRRRRV